MQDCSLYLGKANLMQKNCKKGPQRSENLWAKTSMNLSFGLIRTSQNPRGNTVPVATKECQKNQSKEMKEQQPKQ